jgi:hypothetical protein
MKILYFRDFLYDKNLNYISIKVAYVHFYALVLILLTFIQN